MWQGSTPRAVWAAGAVCPVNSPLRPCDERAGVCAWCTGGAWKILVKLARDQAEAGSCLEGQCHIYKRNVLTHRPVLEGVVLDILIYESLRHKAAEPGGALQVPTVTSCPPQPVGGWEASASSPLGSRRGCLFPRSEVAVGPLGSAGLWVSISLLGLAHPRLPHCLHH